MSQHQHQHQHQHHHPSTQSDATTPTHDIHAGRPVAPEYRERGERLMQEWAREDLFSTYNEEG